MSFKKYREEKKAKIETMETVFGSHSEPKAARNVMETVFGSHSLILEDSNISGILTDKNSGKHINTVAQHIHLHEKVAPIDHKNMSDNERESVHDYSDDSRPINSMLHQHAKGHDISVPSKVAYKKIVGHLDSVLRRRKTTEDMHVYTGLKKSPAAHFKKEGGRVPEKKEVHLPAFTSTSTSIKSARGFAEETMHPNDERHGITYPDDGHVRHILKIHVPKGSHAMSLKEKSFAPEENEILMARGHHIEIHHQPEHISKDTYMWHARVVGHHQHDLDKPVE